jgi:subfamily B ATP-binding cassette protein HlyB/CyaB
MSKDQGILALSLISRFFNVPVNEETIKHNLAKNTGEEFTAQDIVIASKEIGLKAKIKKVNFPSLDPKTLPAIIFNEKNEYVILAKINGKEALVQRPLESKPEKISLENISDEGFSSIIFFSKRESLIDDTTKFGFSWFFNALKKYKKHVFDVLLASFFVQILALATPIFFQTVIDKVIVHNGISTLDVLAIGFIVVILVDFALNFLRTYVLNHTANRLDVTLGSALYKHLVSLPITYFDTRRVGQTVARVRELESVRQFITGSTITLTIDAFFTIVFFAVMFYYSTMLGFIVLCSVPLYFLIAALVTPVLRKNLDEKFQYGAENQAYLVESITGIQTLKAKALEARFSRSWDEKLAAFTNSSFAVAQIGNVGSNLTQLVSKSVTIAILWFGANAVLANEITMGQLIAVNILAGRISGPILRLAQLWQDFQQIHISVNRLGEILNVPTERKNGASDTRLPSLKGEVKFEDLTFGYNQDQKPVINNFNLDVTAGSVIGIVGRSGSGKSTLTKLLQRLYIPSGGRVLVDGVDTRLADVTWLRQQIGVVLQENFLFSRSIRENIALSDPGMNDEDVINAAKLAGAHEFIVELPEGYNTVLAEQGGGLSGGQKQRIAIARALITNPRILIFDEATSALDYESEALIQSNMAEIAKDRTVFIIAHRLSTVRKADKIIVMEHGTLVESGNHNELMAMEDGYYKRLNGFQSTSSLEGM